MKVKRASIWKTSTTKVRHWWWYFYEKFQCYKTLRVACWYFECVREHDVARKSFIVIGCCGLAFSEGDYIAFEFFLLDWGKEFFFFLKLILSSYKYTWPTQKKKKKVVCKYRSKSLGAHTFVLVGTYRKLAYYPSLPVIYYRWWRLLHKSVERTFNTNIYYINDEILDYCEKIVHVLWISWTINVISNSVESDFKQIIPQDYVIWPQSQWGDMIPWSNFNWIILCQCNYDWITPFYCDLVGITHMFIHSNCLSSFP